MAAFSALAVTLTHRSEPQGRPKSKLPQPRQLDKGIRWRRDPVTGELRAVPKGQPDEPDVNSAQPSARAIKSVTRMVSVTCSAYDVDGAPILGLKRPDFRVYDDSIEQQISYFDASTEAASVALIIDASPSVLRDSAEMKDAARALVQGLAPDDQAAVVDFSAHTYLQIGFSSDRRLLRTAVSRVDVRSLLGDTGGSNIYEAVYLASTKLFQGGNGRKAIVLLTDGQDSGLGLTLDPASASLRRGDPRDRLTFDDVTQMLAAGNIQVFAVSTENRPKIMRPEWLAANNANSFLTRALIRSGVPAYTLYLAELVRRTGGQLYFLHEAQTMADTFQRIARRIRAEYTLGFSPSPGASGPPHPGWHRLQVQLAGHASARVTYRSAYYVPASP